MCKKFLKIIQLVFIIGCFFINAFAQNSNYDYENWPGKNGVIKTNIELPEQLVSRYDLSLAKGSKESSFFYKISLSVNDQIKKGRLQAKVFSSVKEAQLALVEYLDCLTTPYKPSRLSDNDFKIGDVAFGEDKNEILRLAFTRNNILIIIHAPTQIAKAIAIEIDEKIINALELKEGTQTPSFILPK